MADSYETQMQCFENQMLHKIKNGERLAEREIQTLVYEGYEVAEIAGDDLRWTRCMKTIVELCGEYVAIEWQKGLTECQEDVFSEQPYIVEKRERVVQKVVVEWVIPDEVKEESKEEASNEQEANEPDNVLDMYAKVLHSYMNNENDSLEGEER